MSSNQANRDYQERFTYKDDDAIEKPFNWSQVSRLFRYMKPYKKLLLPMMAVMIMGTVTRLVVPALTILAIDEAIEPTNGVPSLPKLYMFGGLMLLLYVMQWAANTYRIKQTSILGQHVIHDLRQDLFRHIQRLSFRFFDKRPAGSVLVRVTNDVNALQDLFTNGVVNLLMDCVQLVGIVLILLIWNFKLGAAIMITVPLMFIVSSALRRRIRFAWQDVRMKQSRINAHLNESIQGIKVTQAYAQEKANFSFFNHINNVNIKAWNKASTLNQAFGPIIEVTSALGTLILFWYGSHLIQHNEITVGLLVGFANYIGNFWDPINRLGQMYAQLLIAMASSERIFEFIDEQPTVAELPDAMELPAIRGHVTFDSLVFEYEKGRPALRGISLNVKAGQTIALVGHTGSGKSTIMNLLCRFYDPNEGAVYIDGIDIRDVSLESLRSQVGIVLQDTFIFSGTIRENIRFGRLGATDDEIVKAATAVDAHDFIMNLPDGYDTEVQERGSSLSMGQRQLLSFARALLADPKVLILDEATASIDTETELKIQEALKKLLHGRTSFIVAHRLSTIRGADRIVVLDHGVIVEQGTHEELMRHGGTYFGLIEAQYRFLSA